MVQALLVVLLVAGLGMGGQQWWIKHLNDKHQAYVNQEAKAKLRAYEEAYNIGIKIGKAGEKAAATYRANVAKIEEVTNAPIDTSAVPECRLPDGVRDAVNSARAAANSASARRVEGAVSGPSNDGREARQPRKTRGE